MDAQAATPARGGRPPLADGRSAEVPPAAPRRGLEVPDQVRDSGARGERASAAGLGIDHQRVPSDLMPLRRRRGRGWRADRGPSVMRRSGRWTRPRSRVPPGFRLLPRGMDQETGRNLAPDQVPPKKPPRWRERANTRAISTMGCKNLFFPGRDERPRRGAYSSSAAWASARLLPATCWARVAAMNGSRSPSSTPCVSEVSWFVRRSFTIW